ncbi:hypothetical protein [Brachybacterium hainanense]|uniref:Polyketide cyclase / dehydrase and lipid transport n=1 Tax=Brachybacterium hainanense TaxID=1541174 RepID=A0ABV6RD66_9MICO
MSYAMEETVQEHPARRLTLATPARFDTLVHAFEAVVPMLSEEEALTQLTPDWAAFVRGLEWEAPSGFVRTATSRPSDLLQHAGSRSRSIVWTIVHHPIAARLHRLEPATLLSTHLRIQAHTTARPGTVLTLDVPSAALRAFGSNKITQGGVELDRALGDLLEDLGLPRPSVLRR